MDIKKSLAIIIGWLLLIIAFSIYIYAIYVAIFHPINPNDPVKIHIPDPLNTLANMLGAILSLNLGAVLGISIVKPKSALAAMTLLNRNEALPPDPVTMRDIIQYIAVIIYLLALIACFIKWCTSSFIETPKPVVELVVQNGKELIGVIVGYTAFVIGVRNS